MAARQRVLSAPGWRSRCTQLLLSGHPTRLLLAALQLAAGLLLPLPSLAAPRAQQPAVPRQITSVSPDVVEQGETIVLTISGTNLPTGSVVVEFYPQHIALLDILLANDTRVVAQIKVPNQAPAGQYNIVIYNQLGDEAFAEAMLSVGAKLLTPVFHDYNPKEIAKATGAFALVLSGDSVTPEVVDYLRMEWTRKDQPVSGLQTTFSYGGSGKIVCAVSGSLPGGLIQGSLLLNDKPIYLVEVTIQVDQPLIAGNSPARFAVDQAPYVIKLLGSGFSAALIADLAVELSSADTTARPRKVEVTDAASLLVEFNGPLPAASYTLKVMAGETELYSAPIELTAAAIPPETAATAPPEQPAQPAQQEQPTAQPPAETSVQPETQPAAVPAATMSQPAAAATAPAEEGAAAPGWTPADGISSIEPTVIPAGDTPCRFSIGANGLASETIERLELSLRFGDVSCELLFVGAAGDALTCLFAPPEGGWVSGAAGVLTVRDPLIPGQSFTADVKVSATSGIVSAPAAGAAAAVEPPTQPAAESPAAPSTGAAGQVSISAAGLPAKISPVGFALLLIPTAADPAVLPALSKWEDVDVNSSLIVLDRNLGSFQVAATNRTSGDTPVLALQFKRDAEKLPDLAYGVLLDELVSKDNVGISLVWPQLGLKLDLKTKFERSEDSDSGEVLDELGLGG